MVDVDSSSHLSADSHSKSVNLVWQPPGTQSTVCIHQMNQVNSRNGYGHNDNTINIIVVIIIII